MRAAAPPLVDAAWLAERLDAPDVHVVDATWSVDRPTAEHRAAYEAAHIPGAVFFDLADFSDPDDPRPNMLAGPVRFSSKARRLGLGDGTTIVVYDQSGLFSAARAWWALKAMGHGAVSVLDGGLPAWRAHGGALNDRPPSPRASHFSARLQSGLVKEAGDVARALETCAAEVIDARSPGRFAGDEGEARADLRPGHMPGAKNVPYKTLLTEEGRMRGPEELRAAFEKAGVDLTKPAVTTCGSGITAAILALALDILGHDRWAIYDGSWAEWGADPARPVATGAA